MQQEVLKNESFCTLNWIPNTYENYDEFVVPVMLTPVVNI